MNPAVLVGGLMVISGFCIAYMLFLAMRNQPWLAVSALFGVLGVGITCSSSSSSVALSIVMCTLMGAMLFIGVVFVVERTNQAASSVKPEGEISKSSAEQLVRQEIP